VFYMFRTSYVQGQELSSTCFGHLMFKVRNCLLHVSDILFSRSGIVFYMFRTSYVQGQELSSTCFKHLMFIFRKTILYMQPYLVCCPYGSYNKSLHRILKYIKVCCAVPQPTAPPAACTLRHT
jgi:hypothetical protein